MLGNHINKYMYYVTFLFIPRWSLYLCLSLSITDSCNPYILVESWIVLHWGSERAFLHHGLSNCRNPSILWHPCPFTVIFVSIFTSAKAESWFFFPSFSVVRRGEYFRNDCENCYTQFNECGRFGVIPENIFKSDDDMEFGVLFSSHILLCHRTNIIICYYYCYDLHCLSVHHDV